MKVLDVYYEKDLDLISSQGKSIRDMMDIFFQNFLILTVKITIKI